MAVYAAFFSPTGTSRKGALAIAGALRRRGVPLPDGIFTMEQLEAAILSCRREGAPC